MANYAPVVGLAEKIDHILKNLAKAPVVVCPLQNNSSHGACYYEGLNNCVAPVAPVDFLRQSQLAQNLWLSN